MADMNPGTKHAYGRTFVMGNPTSDTDSEGKPYTAYEHAEPQSSYELGHAKRDQLRGAFDCMIYDAIAGYPGALEWSAFPEFFVEDRPRALDRDDDGTETPLGIPVWLAGWRAKMSVVGEPEKDAA